MSQTDVIASTVAMSATDYAMAIFAFVSALGAIAAAAVAFVTYRSATAPNVVAYLESDNDTHTVYLLVKNFGNGIAYDVSINLDGDIHIMDQLESIVSRGFISKGVPMLVPEGFRKTMINSSGNLSEKMGTSIVNATVTCYRSKSKLRREVKNVCILDVYSFNNSVHTDSLELRSVKAIEKIAKNM